MSSAKKQTGCLLIHGFTGSPNEFLELGKFLQERGIAVSTPILPGHATHAADLFNYTWRDWFDSVKLAYEKLATECSEVFVCGLSMGGTLALHLAAHRAVHGLITLSAVVEFPRWKKVAVRNLKSVVKFLKKSGGEDVRDDSSREKLGSYQRYPVYAVHQLFQLADHVREDLPEIIQPILVMHSRLDNTIDFHNAEIIYNEIGSTDKRKVDLEQSYHVITVDVEKEIVQNEVYKFIAERSRFYRKLGLTKNNQGSVNRVE